MNPATDPRWRAVQTRDAQHDGAFFYSVETTGVYCRPSCPSRLAHPKNVAFHATTADAERAGFRACKRCRPNEPPARLRHAHQVAALCRFIDACAEPPSLDALAVEAGLSPSATHRRFKGVMGMTPRAYAAAERSERMRMALRSSDSVSRAIHDTGYGSSSRFYEEAAATLGMTPTAFRAGGTGEVISFAAGECALGSFVVAATARGVCAILLGGDPLALVRDLEARFPGADLRPGDRGFERTVASVVALLDRPDHAHELPLDLRGTAFQRRVWQALTEIPPGSTLSYGELAERLGVPGGARAVAGACASNPLAVAIPCHRVVRADGGLGGYRWGIERKRALLSDEVD